MTKTIDERIERNREEFKRYVQGIREDPDLSDSAKEREIGKAYYQALDTHNTLYEQKRADIKERALKARKGAFAPPSVFGADKAAIMSSYRDALDRVAGERDVRVLEELLERAEYTGDEVLAKAIFHRGVELDTPTLVDAYLAGRPEERLKYDEYLDASVTAGRFEDEHRLWGHALAPAPPFELDAASAGVSGQSARSSTPQERWEANDQLNAVLNQAIGGAAPGSEEERPEG